MGQAGHHTSTAAPADRGNRLGMGVCEERPARGCSSPPAQPEPTAENTLVSPKRLQWGNSLCPTENKEWAS